MKKLLLLGVVICLLAVPVMAQSQIGLKGYGVHAGIVLPESPVESTLGFGARIDIGTITPTLHIAIILDYWSKSYDHGVGLGTNAEWKWSEIVIGPMATYYLSDMGTMKPYVGGGLGFTIAKWSWDYNDEFLGDMDSSGSDTELGFFGVAGIETALSTSMIGFAEAKYHLGGVDYLAIFAGIKILK
ncbi:outer membrane beta-barrel protein [bacterium]|nr:outer membrane beta-barrel protein [bacterium]